MNETELNTLLLNEFPELLEEFEEYTSWMDGMDTGCFLTYEDLLLPRIRTAFIEGDEPFRKRSCRFIEHLLLMGDGYAANVATVGLLEKIKSDVDAKVVRPYLLPTSLEVFDDPTL